MEGAAAVRRYLDNWGWDPKRSGEYTDHCDDPDPVTIRELEASNDEDWGQYGVASIMNGPGWLHGVGAGSNQLVRLRSAALALAINMNQAADCPYPWRELGEALANHAPAVVNLIDADIAQKDAEYDRPAGQPRLAQSPRGPAVLDPSLWGASFMHDRASSIVAEGLKPWSNNNAQG
jgi:hypothetical protein